MGQTTKRVAGSLKTETIQLLILSAFRNPYTNSSWGSLDSGKGFRFHWRVKINLFLYRLRISLKMFFFLFFFSFIGVKNFWSCIFSEWRGSPRVRVIAGVNYERYAEGIENRFVNKKNKKSIIKLKGTKIQQYWVRGLWKQTGIHSDTRSRHQLRQNTDVDEKDAGEPASFFVSLVISPQWATVDAKIKIPSAENPELHKRFSR